MKPATRKRLAQVLWTILFFGPPLLLVVLSVHCILDFGGSCPTPEQYNQRIAPKQAATLAHALNAYFGDHHEYPPQILGGVALHLKLGSDYVLDPLLEGHYLRKYPAVKSYTRNQVAILDPRKTGIKNLVSAPYDPVVEWIVREHKPPEPAKPILWNDDEEYQQQRTEDYVEAMEQYRERLESWEELKEEVAVILVAGGIDSGGHTGSLYSVVPPAIEQRLNSVLDPVTRQYGRLQLRPQGIPVNFGYVRGERMGKDKMSAFLWIYGMPPENYYGHVGLDLLNAETGELVPDGIPDAVLLLYELRDGEVVGVTRAEDM